MAEQSPYEQRISRLEKQHDDTVNQMYNIGIRLAEIAGNMSSLSTKMTDFIDTVKDYIDKHDVEHKELKATDDLLKKYLFIALGAVSIISFVAPYVIDLIFK